ncbi:MAG: alpha-glucosidase [Clostridia bacterium]|nr:alpha-glucosidase [Clostridia bacterium]
MEKTWFREMTVFQIWPRSFKDGNGDGIGDLKGILSKLDYIKELGADAIWFSPLYVSPQADYGYDIADYYNINPEYGTLDEFKEVLAGAHERGIKVIMDLVINHTSDQCEWFKKSAAGDPQYKDYYIWRPGRGKDGKKFPNNWMATFPGDGWTYNEQRGEYYLHLFAVEQPDLNHDNPAVREEVKKIMRYWLDMGVDGFREDVITMISKREGLPNGIWLPAMRGMEHYMQGPNLLKYLTEYRQVTKDYDCMQVGEAPMMTPKKALLYISDGDDKVLDMMFGFQHMEADCLFISWIHTGFNLKKLKKVYNNWQTMLYDKGWNANYIENHDQPRNISRYGSLKYRVESGKALATMYSFLSGTQFIYQGQEIGMVDYPFETWDDFVDVSTFSTKSLLKKLKIFSDKKILKMAKYAARDNARTPVQWSAEANAGFTTPDAKPWYLINPNYKEVNVEAAQKDPDSILNYYKKVIALRKQYKDAAIYGQFKLYLKGDKQLFVYDKIGEENKLTVVINLSEKEVASKKVKKFIPEGAQEILANYEGMGDKLRPYETHVYLTKNK